MIASLKKWTGKDVMATCNKLLGFYAMNNNSWVCFECRESYRRDKQYKGNVACAKCNCLCTNIGDCTPVPRKRELKAWKYLRESINKQARQSQLHSDIELVRIKHDIEQGEERIEALDKGRDRESTLKKINNSLRKRNLLRRNKT